MCLHPKADVNCVGNDTLPDREMEDNCDYIYNIDHVDHTNLYTNVDMTKRVVEWEF